MEDGVHPQAGAQPQWQVDDRHSKSLLQRLEPCRPSAARFWHRCLTALPL